MSLAVDALSWALLLAGGAFCVLGGVGLLRLPDFYSRAHAGGLTDTLGSALLLAGLALQAGWGLVAVKLGMIALLLHIANPTGTHALAKAAFRRGVRFEGSEPNDDPAA